MPTDPCPSESRLREFLLGKGNPAELEEIARHLAVCPACEGVVERAEAEAETLLRGLRDAFPASPTTQQAPDAVDDRRSAQETVAETGPRSSDETVDHQHLTPGTTGSTLVETGQDGQLARGTVVRYFGDYEIRRELGRGGMGVVYQARQVSLNRAVALKMIKAGLLAGDDDLRRFQVEAEAVALLDHPGIVPVYEVGEHDGQRYLSMKLVPGGSLVPRLASYCDNPKAAARLVAEAAEAVHHAHSRGILHRDLKPANLLVDDAGHPYVTDFGLAKRIEEDVELTASGAILGTPAYMSPEQANGRRGTITTASDVYGLGAILYALLTGKAPFGGDSVVETLDAVRTQPPQPLTKFNAKVPRNLETICLKCLEKDLRRRYASAHELALDLTNWLESRPITARRVPAAERAWLWCRRRPAIAALSATTLLAVVGGTTGIIVTQAQANDRLQRQVTATKTAETLADARLDRAMAAIKDYYSGFSEEAITAEQIPKALREQLLAKPVQFYEELTRELAAKPDPSPREQTLLADGQLALARILFILGRYDESRRQGEAAITRFEALLAAQPGVPENQHGLAVSYSNLGLLLQATGEPAAAREALKKAITRGESLVAAWPGVPEYQDRLAASYGNLGNVLQATGELGAAREALQKSISQFEALVTTQPVYQNGLANSYNTLGIVLQANGDSGAAREAFQQAITHFEALVTAHPGVAELQHGLALSHNNLGSLLQTIGEPAAAAEAHQRAIARFEALVAAEPGVPLYRRRLAMSYSSLGIVLQVTGDPRAAREAIQKAIARFEALVTAYPGVPELQQGLAQSHNNLGSVLQTLGEPTAAGEAHQRAITRFEALVAAHPGVPEHQKGLAVSYTCLGNVLKSTGKPAAAREAYQKAITRFEALVASQPVVPDYQNGLAISYHNLAKFLLETGQLAAAREAYNKAITWSEALVAEQQGVPDYLEMLARSYNDLGVVLRTTGEPAAAREAYLKAITLYEALVAAQPSAPEYQNVLAMCSTNLGVLLGQEGDPKEALAAFRKARASAVPGSKVSADLPGLIRQTEAEVATGERLDAVLRGDEKPRDNADRLTLAQLCYNRKLHAAAARLWAEALTTDPKLSDNRQSQHRYNAACAAALAAASQGKDVPPPDDTTRAKLRDQARAWLEAERATWARLMVSADPQQKAYIAQTLQHWQQDTDLAGIRDDAELAKLPDDERTAWKTLWADVDTLKSRAASPSAE